MEWDTYKWAAVRGKSYLSTSLLRERNALAIRWYVGWRWLVVGPPYMTFDGGGMVECLGTDRVPINLSTSASSRPGTNPPPSPPFIDFSWFFLFLLFSEMRTDILERTKLNVHFRFPFKHILLHQGGWLKCKETHIK